jgi:histidinol-phosphatase
MIEPDRLAEDLEFAHRLADRAAEVSLEYFHRGVDTIIKADDTPVSEADLETDRRMVELIEQERPDDAILSEESGDHGDSNRRWIVDPIDGTFNFVERDPMWGNHVALEVDGELVLGVITRPVEEQRWWATTGNGAFRADGNAAPQRLSVSTTTDLAQARLCIWSHLDDEQLMVWGNACTVVRPSALDNVLHVIQGDIDAVIETRGRHWDNAPAIVLVTEAGGRYTDPEGGIRPDLSPCRYTNGRVDAALDAFLAGGPVTAL